APRCRCLAEPDLSCPVPRRRRAIVVIVSCPLSVVMVDKKEQPGTSVKGCAGLLICNGQRTTGYSCVSGMLISCPPPDPVPPRSSRLGAPAAAASSLASAAAASSASPC